MRTLVRALVRLSAVLAGVGAYFYLAATLFDHQTGDANIGVGLLMFGLLALTVTAWAFVDGFRSEGLLLALLPWVAVAFTVGVALPVAVAATEDLDGEVLVGDLIGTIPFMIVLVLVPAALAVVVGKAAGASRSAEQRSRK